MTLSIDLSPQPFRASLPDGLVLGEFTMQDVLTTFGEPAETDSLAGEGVTLYSYQYRTGSEGSIIHDYGTGFDWSDDSTRTDFSPDEVAAQPATSFSVHYLHQGG